MPTPGINHCGLRHRTLRLARLGSLGFRPEPFSGRGRDSPEDSADRCAIIGLIAKKDYRKGTQAKPARGKEPPSAILGTQTLPAKRPLLLESHRVLESSGNSHAKPGKYLQGHSYKHQFKCPLLLVTSAPSA